MNAIDTAVFQIQEMAALGVVLDLDERAELVFEAPVGVLTEEHKAELRENKPALVLVLAERKRAAKVSTWPPDVRAAYEKIVDELNKKRGLPLRASEEKAFRVLKRLAIFRARMEDGGEAGAAALEA